MIDRLLKSLFGAAALTTLAALPLAGQERPEKSPYEKPDDSWISLDGTVQEVRPGEFTLSYGEGVVTVEMDDGDRDADAYKLMEGDSVAVTGVVDDDFLETTTIEASSVYVKNLGTTFYASAVDEEDIAFTWIHPANGAEMELRGTVTEVGEDEFTLNTGLRSIEVEIDEMAYDPLDDEGYQKIRVGDRVSVTGDLDHDLFEGNVVEADWVITLQDEMATTNGGR